MRIASCYIAIAILCAGCNNKPAPTNLPPNPRLSANAPEDKPVASTGKAESDAIEKAIAPYVEQGRKTYPEAKQRYLAGLPADHHFFVVTDLKDDAGASERVFVSVASIEGDKITGRIANAILLVKGYKEGDAYSFPETQLRDWLIAHPDGSEEGNFVGKFMDEWQKTRGRK